MKKKIVAVVILAGLNTGPVKRSISTLIKFVKNEKSTDVFLCDRRY